MKMNLDHLEFPTDSWGYMPPQKDIFDVFQYVQDNYKPESIFEIGYCWGHSTTYQMEIMPQAQMVTIGPIEEPWIKADDKPDPKVRKRSIRSMYQKYGRERFQHINGRTKFCDIFLLKEFTNFFDYALIDGDHKKVSAEIDAALCQDLNIPVVLIDNWDQKSVRDGVEIGSDYKELKVFEYDQTWKGLYRRNVIGLCTL